VCAIVLLLRHFRQWRRGLRAVLAMLPTVILAITAFAEDQMEKGYMKQGDGFAITSVHLTLNAKVPGADKAKFEELAGKAKAGCPVSKLLNTRITLDATLQ